MTTITARSRKTKGTERSALSRTPYPLTPSVWNSFLSRCEVFFDFEERGASWATEIRAGLVTFLTMSYVLVVNPKIMHTHWCDKAGHEGMCPSIDDVVIATALSSAAGSLVCGLSGQLPFVLAPGIGLSAYFSYGLVIHGAKLDKEVALATVVISGVVITILSAMKASAMIMKYMPDTIKTATVVGMGLLIAFVGFHSTKMVVPDSDSVVKLGDLYTAPSLLTMAGLILVGVLTHHNVKGSILIGILSVTLFSWIFKIDNCVLSEGGTYSYNKTDTITINNHAYMEYTYNPTTCTFVPGFPTEWMRIPVIDTVPHDVIVKGLVGLDHRCILPVVTFVLVSVLDIAGVMFGVAKMADLVEADNSVKGGQAAFISCGVGSVIAGILGSTPVIVGIESASGVSEGGRTGVVACVVAMLFTISTFFAPLIGHIPPQATAPVLILIGTMMAKNAADIEWGKLTEAIPAFLTIVVMPFTFSIPNGLAAGLAAYVLMWLLTGGWQQWWRLSSLEEGYSTLTGMDDQHVGGSQIMGSVVVERDSVLERSGQDSPTLGPESVPRGQWGNSTGRTPENPSNRNSFTDYVDPDVPGAMSTQLGPAPRMVL